MSHSDDKDPPLTESDNPEKPLRKHVQVRFDEEHYEALLRIADFENLNVPDTLRKLIRIADQMISGTASPFASRLEHLLLPRKVG